MFLVESKSFLVSGLKLILCFRVTMDFLDAAMAVSKGQAKKDI